MRKKKEERIKNGICPECGSELEGEGIWDMGSIYSLSFCGEGEVECGELIDTQVLKRKIIKIVCPKCKKEYDTFLFSII